jgi:hypothetical protein
MSTDEPNKNIPNNNKYEILKGVFGKMKSLGSEESDLSMSQQKNEMNLFTEGTSPII